VQRALCAASVSPAHVFQVATSAESADEAAKVFHMIVACGACVCCCACLPAHMAHPHDPSPAGYNGEIKFFENRGKPKDV
jgi:hypothetical protein